MRYVFDLGTRFEAVASAHADRPALRLPDGATVSYAAILDRSRRLRSILRGHGLTQRRPLAILHGKTTDGYAAMLAALGCGVPYACLDERNPTDRQALVLDTLKPGLVVATGMDAATIDAARQALAVAGIECPLLDLDTDDASEASPLPATGDAIGSDVAYVMFTSGSTGRPKGVAISHANVANFVDWTRDVFAIRADDVLSNVNPMHFDNAVFDVYASLFNGAALAPVPRASLDQPPAVVRALDGAGCTLLFAVPSLLIYLQSMRALTADSLPALRLVSFGGEGFAKPELHRMYQALGGRVRMVNVYGPTECTCICSTYDVSERDFIDLAALAPIGPMAANFRGLVLDGDTVVTDGEVGELCLIGPNVGLGYYGDQARTLEAFTNNPLRPELPERMYRTGDFVRRDADGLFHFVGRRDQQIKHMGHRIELGEIEAVLNAIGGVRQAAVVYCRDNSPFGRVVAVVAVDEANLGEPELLDMVRRRLPQYMVPHRIEVRDQLPRNANGKIDRRRLAEELA